MITSSFGFLLWSRVWGVWTEEAASASCVQSRMWGGASQLALGLGVRLRSQPFPEGPSTQLVRV